MQWQEHFSRHHQRQLYFREAGDKQAPPLVFLHGFAEDGEVWIPFAEAFAHSHRIIVPDLPGSGKSLALEGPHSMTALADSIRLLLDDLGLDTCTMIGHSMGGYITLAFAEKTPERLQGFGLFHSTAYADNEEKKAARNKNITFIRVHGAERFVRQTVPNLFGPAFLEAHADIVRSWVQRNSNFPGQSLVRYTEAMRDRPDRTGILKQARCPVLFILGEHDRAVPLEDGLRQSEMPEFAYIYISTRSGHMGMLEDPEFCVQAIRDFLGVTSVPRRRNV